VFQDASHEEVHTALTHESLAGTYGGALPALGRHVEGNVDEA
jgi:hypothetical protein